MSFEDLIKKYIDNTQSIQVRIIKDDSEDVLFFISFLENGVTFNQMAFIKDYHLNKELFYTKMGQATDFLRRQPILIELFEAIAFKIMEKATEQERREILDKYDNTEGDLFIDESSFFIAKYVLEKIIKIR
jgi:hypothetical protein